MCPTVISRIDLPHELNVNTKMSLRAVVVAVLCILVTNTFTLQRSYWIFLTAFMLITQSFGDGIYRSLARFVLTVIGCLIGWIIYLPLAHHPHMLVLVSFTALFLMLYWFTTSMVGRNIATGILLVSSFGLMSGGWTFNMLMARISDTLIGAAIAVLVNGLILPEFSRANMQNIFKGLRIQLFDLDEQTQKSASLQDTQAIYFRLQELEAERLNLKQSYHLARYELLFRKQRRQHYKAMLLQTDIVFSYLNALLDNKVAGGLNESDIKTTLAKSAKDYYEDRLEIELKKLAEL